MQLYNDIKFDIIPYMSQLEKLIEKIKRANTDVPLKDLEKILTTFGYEKVRQKGSHVHFRKKGAPFFTVPTHEKKVKIVYVKEILKLLDV